MFKKILVLACTLVTTLAFSACGEQTADQQTPAQNQPETAQIQKFDPPEQFAGKKMLVAYYSRTGDNYQVGVIEKDNTAIVADMIAAATGADEIELKPVKEYPTDYKECTEVAKQEQADNARPEVATKIENFADYDVVFVGYPIWWSDLPMMMYTFLESYDWTGKTIIPFCTSAGNAMTGKEADIPNFAKGSIVIDDGLGIQGARCQADQAGVQKDVELWLDKIGFMKKQ